MRHTAGTWAMYGVFMKDLKTAVRGFVEELVRRDGTRAVLESSVRGAIAAYVKCVGIAYRGKRELTPAQMRRALGYYHQCRAQLTLFKAVESPAQRLVRAHPSDAGRQQPRSAA